MTTPDQRNMRNWAPYEHIDAACDLLDEEARFTEPHDSTTTPVLLVRAQTHVAIATAKMMGRGRA